jgi:hypothetical protein
MTEKILNAFHPDYIKTYHPEMIESTRRHSSQVEHGKRNGAKSREKREQIEGRFFNTIDKSGKLE